MPNGGWWDTGHTPSLVMPYHGPVYADEHRLSDEDIERVARRVVELMKAEG